MVIGKVALETVKASAKVYIRDASVAYSSAFLGGVMAGAGFVGLKDGIEFGKKLPGYAKAGWKKLTAKKVDKMSNQIDGEFKPEGTQD